MNVENAEWHNELMDFIGIDSFNRGILAIRKERIGHLKETKYELVLINLGKNNKTVEKVRPQSQEAHNPED